MSVTISLTHAYMQDDVTIEQFIKATPIRNVPRMAAFINQEEREYFVLIEQSVLCKVSTLSQALFIVFSSYYVCNLQYPIKG